MGIKYKIYRICKNFVEKYEHKHRTKPHILLDKYYKIEERSLKLREDYENYINSVIKHNRGKAFSELSTIDRAKLRSLSHLKKEGDGSFGESYKSFYFLEGDAEGDYNRAISLTRED